MDVQTAESKLLGIDKIGGVNLREVVRRLLCPVRACIVLVFVY